MKIGSPDNFAAVACESDSFALFKFIDMQPFATGSTCQVLESPHLPEQCDGNEYCGSRVRGQKPIVRDVAKNASTNQ